MQARVVRRGRKVGLADSNLELWWSGNFDVWTQVHLPNCQTSARTNISWKFSFWQWHQNVRFLNDNLKDGIYSERANMYLPWISFSVYHLLSSNFTNWIGHSIIIFSCKPPLNFNWWSKRILPIKIIFKFY